MIIIEFLNGLAFGGLGLAAYMQYRYSGVQLFRKQLPWLAAFGFTYGATAWIDMFLISNLSQQVNEILNVLRIILQPLSGLLIFIFGLGMLKQLALPSWVIFIPGILIVPIAFVLTYAMTTFITPSPIEIPIDIWSRYLIYLPGSIMAGVGFLRLHHEQRKLGYKDVSNLMLGAGLAFLFEALVVGLIVPAAPYGPASYYNYNRSIYDAFIGEQLQILRPYGFTAWLDYAQVLSTTGLPIQFWRMLSAIPVTFFVIRGLGVFNKIQERHVRNLLEERDRAQKAAFEAETEARQVAESWTEALVNITRRITEFENVDSIFIYILENAQKLLASDYIAVALVNDSEAFLELKCFSTDHRSEMVKGSVRIQNPVIMGSFINSQPYSSKPDDPPELFDQVCFGDGCQAKSLGIVPLTFNNQSIGVLWIARKDNIGYTETDLIWLASMADQIVITIQHSLMTSQLQSLSVVEERTRIAREMHDGLAQVLGYLNLQLQTLESLHERRKWKSLFTELGQMRNAVRIAQADVRENILSLRTTLSNEKGLVASIHDYLDEFGIQTGVDINFLVDIEDELALSPLAEVQLVFILQEALTNVRKHAHANQVDVTLVREETFGNKVVCLKVLDNGIGFETINDKRCFGMQTMRERAQSVGGTFAVISSLGDGTRIECHLPCV